MGEGGPDITMAVFGVSGLLALVTLLVPVAARANVAFSLVLAASGIVLGLTAQAARRLGLDGISGDFLAALGGFNLSSEAFILVFLPVLLFETAVAVDVRRLIDDLAPILLLAVVAVLVSTFVIGCALGAVTDVGLVAALLLAAIVSTTDPIAVVAIFRELGVPHRLALLVEGESLFNDAAAISLFTVFLAMLTGERRIDGVLDGAWVFFRGFAGGLGLGAVSGLVVCWAFSPLRGQRFAEITLTVAAAYLVFLLGEHYLHVSGVVAVVTAGLVIGYYGRTQVSAETWSSLVDVWQQLGYWASALIFLLAMMRVPDMLAGMGPDDLFLLGVLIISALAARALVLFGLFPGLTWLGWSDPVPAPLRAVVLWGGLRGAISLALALAVLENPQVDEAVKEFVSVLCTGFVLFTLFVNAPLLRPLIRLFGLDRLSPADMVVRGRAIATAHEAVRDRVRVAARDYGIEPGVVEELCRASSQRLVAAEAEIAARVSLAVEDEVRGGLAMIAAREHALYLRHYREGVVSGRITRTLLANAARLQDGVKTGGEAGYVAAVAVGLAYPVSFRLALMAQRRLGVKAPLARAIANRTEILLVSRAAQREVTALVATWPPARLSAVAGRRVGAILAARAKAADVALEALRLQYGDFSTALELKYLERAAIRIEEAEYRRLRAEAAIGHDVFLDLMRDLAGRGHRLDVRPPLDLRLDPQGMVARVPLFAGLGPDRQAAIIRRLRSRLVVPGETILRRGERGDAMFFIVSGAVEVCLPAQPVRLGSGDFFGEMALVTNGPRSADVVALGYCSLLVLRERDYAALIEAGSDLRREIDETARRRRDQARARAGLDSSRRSSARRVAGDDVAPGDRL